MSAACPCLHTTPCHDGCTCVRPLSSSGCRRCCTYGSAEQQAAMAVLLAEHIDFAPALAAEDMKWIKLEWKPGPGQLTLQAIRRDESATLEFLRVVNAILALKSQPTPRRRP